MSNRTYLTDWKKPCSDCGKECEFTFNVHPQMKVYCRDCWVKKERGVPNLQVLFSVPFTLADWPWNGAEARYEPSLNQTFGDNPKTIIGRGVL